MNSCIQESFLDMLDEEGKKELLDRGTEVSVPKGTLLFQQSEVCPSVLFLTRGKVRVYLSSEEGNELTLYVLNPGQQCIVNTSSVLAGIPAIGSAQVVEDIQGILVSAKTLKEMILNSSRYREYMFSLFSLRLQSFALLVEELRFKTLDSRIMNWLVSLPEQSVLASHEEIATRFGTSRVVVSRVLKGMEKAGQIRMERKKITLL